MSKRNRRPNNITLSVDTAPRAKSSAKNNLEWVNKPINTVRKDIKDFRSARSSAENDNNPTNVKLQTIYSNIMEDGLLTSQISNRQSKIFNIGKNLKKKDGSVSEQTDLLKNIVPFKDITTAILDTQYYEYSLIDLSWKTNVDGTTRLESKLIPRTNLIPQKGVFLKDIMQPSDELNYREAPEFGIWWLEFGDASKRGILNKAVPHVLMKSFAQSCWAELCEIYGIPPRYMKTNTQDPAMLRRAEKMMRDMGAAAWFIIDETEEFDFAQGVTTNGDVYNNLIALCNNEMSMLISGAIIGQDTKNGSRSKDESAQGVLWELVMQDMYMVQNAWNNTVIPALKKIGVITDDVTLEFDIPEDLEVLWTRVKDSMNNYEFDVEWMNEKFGLKITGVKQTPQAGVGLGVGDGFFV